MLKGDFYLFEPDKIMWTLKEKDTREMAEKFGSEIITLKEKVETLDGTVTQLQSELRGTLEAVMQLVSRNQGGGGSTPKKKKRRTRRTRRKKK
jgi:hypothetical protein